MRIATKLGVGTALVAAITGLLLSLVISTSVQKILQNRLIEDQRTIMENLVYEIDHLMFLAIRDLNMVVEDEFLQSYLANPGDKSGSHRELLEEELEERMELTGPWDVLSVLDSNGKHLFTPGSDRDLNNINAYPNSQVGYLAALSGETYYSDHLISDYSGKSTVILAAPVWSGEDSDKTGEHSENGEKEDNGEVVGVMLGHYEWEAIETLLERTQSKGSIHLFDAKGRVIAWYASEHKHLQDKEQASHPLSQQAMSGKKFGYGIFETLGEHDTSFAMFVGEPGYDTYAGNAWWLLLELPAHELFTPAHTLAKKIGVYTFMAFLLLFILLAFLTRKTIQPLMELNEKVSLVGEGDYKQHISLASGDEIGELAVNFNKMVRNLRINSADLAQSRQRYHDLVNEIDDGIIATDAEGVITFANTPFLRMVSKLKDDVVGCALTSFAASDKRMDMQKLIAQGASTAFSDPELETTLLTSDGSLIHVQLRFKPIIDEDKQFNGLRAVVRDITIQKATEEEIFFRATHDSLTGLFNRDSLINTLTMQIARAKREGERISILFIDLDEFKLVNDTLGHEAGDVLLCDVSKRLKKTLRETDTLARHGGDEFLLITSTYCENGAEECEAHFFEHTTIIASRILDALKEPFEIRGQEAYVGASIGISIYPSDGQDTQTLLQHADSAMYRAKELGRNTYHFYSQELSDRQERLVTLANQLHKAVEKQEFILYYQPVVELTSGSIVGVEALIRWISKGKIIPPNEFIPVAEATGMILPIGDWVLQESCRQLHEWEKKGIDIFIAINLSVKQFWKGDISNNLLDSIHTHGVDKKKLELEITESAMTLDTARMEFVLEEFMSHSLSISLDDFGTGYSSLNRLKHLPISKLKIDRSFVDGLPHDQDDSAIVKAIIQMASSLDIKVVAEGIETKDQWSYLRNHNCSYGQGYFFSPPVPPSDVEAMWNSRKATPPDSSSNFR